MPSIRMQLFDVPRIAPLLSLCQAFTMTLQTMGIATTPLAAYAMLGTDKSLATLPIVMVNLGLLASALPASFLMARVGRKLGFMTGSAAGILAGLLSVVAVYQQNFPLLCFASLFHGTAVAFGWYYRFAAAEAATDTNQRARAISLVLAGGMLSSIMGPEVAKLSKDILAPVTFAGVYVMFAVMSAIAMLLLAFIRFPKIAVVQAEGPRRSLGTIMRQPEFIVAATSSMFGYGIMTVFMAATPLAMQACNFTFADSATVIQFHSLAMFAPAFFTGHLINRFGVLRIIATGAILNIGCAVTGFSGETYWHFMIANVLVGFGWNFTFIGGTTLLTTAYRPSEKARTEGAHDFLVYTTTAVGAGMSGVLQANFGFAAVSLIAIPFLLAILLAVAWLNMRQRNEATARQAG